MKFDSTIGTTEDARGYFQFMGCSHFHMSREYPQRYDEYRKLDISKDTEKEWTIEQVSFMLERLKRNEPDERELWAMHSAVADLVADRRLVDFLEDLLEASIAMEPSLRKRHKLLVAETIVGREAISRRSGLVFQCHDSKQAQLASKFAELAHRLVASPFEAAEFEARRTCLLSKLAETELMCRITETSQ